MNQKEPIVIFEPIRSKDMLAPAILFLAFVGDTYINALRQYNYENPTTYHCVSKNQNLPDIYFKVDSARLENNQLYYKDIETGSDINQSELRLSYRCEF